MNSCDLFICLKKSFVIIIVTLNEKWEGQVLCCLYSQCSEYRLHGEFFLISLVYVLVNVIRITRMIILNICHY